MDCLTRNWDTFDAELAAACQLNRQGQEAPYSRLICDSDKESRQTLCDSPPNDDHARTLKPESPGDKSTNQPAQQEEAQGPRGQRPEQTGGAEQEAQQGGSAHE